MEPGMQMAVTVICAVLASSGFWAWIQKRKDRKDSKTKVLMGLAHDRIVHLGMTYMNRGSISKDEYDDLAKYLYAPYLELGGNGTAKRVMDEVERLPIEKVDFLKRNRPRGTLVDVDDLSSGTKRIVGDGR